MKGEIEYVIHAYNVYTLRGNGWSVVYKSGHKRYYGEMKLPKSIANWILEEDTIPHDVENVAIRYDKHYGKIKKN